MAGSDGRDAGLGEVGRVGADGAEGLMVFLAAGAAVEGRVELVRGAAVRCGAGAESDLRSSDEMGTKRVP